MIHELRIYEIFDGNRDAFHARFRDHAARLMHDHGSQIVAMWECRTDERLEFVYLLAWADRAARETSWDAFMADPGWQTIKRETAAASDDLVGAITSRMLKTTDYSPRP